MPIRAELESGGDPVAPDVLPTVLGGGVAKELNLRVESNFWLPPNFWEAGLKL